MIQDMHGICILHWTSVLKKQQPVPCTLPPAIKAHPSKGGVAKLRGYRKRRSRTGARFPCSPGCRLGRCMAPRCSVCWRVLFAWAILAVLPNDGRFLGFGIEVPLKDMDTPWFFGKEFSNTKRMMQEKLRDSFLLFANGSLTSTEGLHIWRTH